MFCDPLDRYWVSPSPAELPPTDEDAVDLSALRRLRDCGSLRVSASNAAMLALYEEGLAEASEVAGRPDKLDYRITSRGRVVANRLLQGSLV